MSERERGNDSSTESGNEDETGTEREYADPADDPENAPTEPRDTEEGQQQAAETEEGEIDAGAEPDDRDRSDHPDADAGETDTHGTTEPVGQRSTAPQSAFTTRQVGIGVAVLAVGLLVTFALPLLLA